MKVSIALARLTVLVTDAERDPDMGEIELGTAAVGLKILRWSLRKTVFKEYFRL